MAALTTIASRFNGPPTSGNGGYSCGLLAAYINGSARVRLHVPPPLDTPLRINSTADGGAQMYDGDILVGSGVPAPLELDIPPAPSMREAREAMKNFPCYEGHAYPTCFVCGPERPHHDGLELHPGRVSDQSLLACVWQPGSDLLDEAGNIRPEYLWSALDCPGYFAAMREELHPALLGELLGKLHTQVAGTDALIVYAWPLGEDGRKFYGGTAIATAQGDVVASARSTWIALKS